MDIEEKMNIAKQVGEEIVTEEELRELLETKAKIVAYDGFEPSGLAHLPFGLLRPINIEKLQKIGFEFIIYLADFFAYINNKLDADMERINACSKYFIEVWKASGFDTQKIKFIYASELMDDFDYWKLFMKVSRNITLKRSLRATTIMGRKASEKLSVAQIYYPALQVTDIFMLGVDVCQLGLDQRRANMLAREIAEKLKLKKPVALHHHMLLGLQGKKESEEMQEIKMSKSKPETSIYVHDSYEEIKRKIMKAYCPEKQKEGNPILEYFKYIIFEKVKVVTIERPEKYGGNVDFYSYEELENQYVNGKIHPLDLKVTCAKYLDALIKPIREHFEKNEKARNLYLKVKGVAK